MIRLGKKDRYTIGIMIGSFHTDYSKMIVDNICRSLEGDKVNIFLFQGFDASRYLDYNPFVNDSFDRHYYSLFEYGKFVRPDLLIVSFGTISAVPSPLSLEEFLAPFGDIPVILLEAESDLKQCVHITVDNYQGMKKCIRHLIEEHGCTRIAYVSGPEAVPDSLLRLHAYRDIMEEEGLEISDKSIVYGDFSDRVDPLIEDLLDYLPDVEAIVCANDEMAESAYRVVNKRGLRIGSDIRITGFDDIDPARYMKPPLTTVRQDFSKVAELTAEIVHRLLEGESISSETIPADVLVRGSCGCTPALGKESEAAEESESEKVIRDRITIKNLQNENITSSLWLRGLITKTVSAEIFFNRLGQLFAGALTARSFVVLVGGFITPDSHSRMFLPETVHLHMAQNGTDIRAWGFDNAPVLGREEFAAFVTEGMESSRQMAEFPLFYGDVHYGALFVELDRDEMMFYYTLSLEIGTGIRYLIMELEQQETHRALEEQNQILDFSASHDVLTGYYNRAGIMKKAFTFIRESGDTDSFMAVMADLDHLKQINDTFGHDEGDAAIRAAADMLADEISDRGIVGRTGGDEYVCFYRITEEGSEETFIRHIKEACRTFNDTSGKPYYVEISVGCHAFDRSEVTDLLSVLKKADVRLYDAKKTRRETVVR